MEPLPSSTIDKLKLEKALLPEAFWLKVGGALDQIPLSQAIDLAQRGELIIIRQGLQGMGVFDDWYTISIDAIKKVASEDIANQIKAVGFEEIHTFLTLNQIGEVIRIIERELQPKVVDIVRRFVEGLMAYKQPYYICKFLPIRFFVPYDTFVDNAKRLKKAGRLNYGRLEILDPHRDSWFTYPFNSLNIWITMSRVIPGNGMIVYPEMWDQSTAHTGSTISREQTFVGQPIDLTMNPGDLLLFRGEHLHASELNFTQETRYATTARFTLKAPIYGEGNLWKPHVYTPFLNTPWERFAEWRSYCSLAFLRMKGLQLKKKLIKQPKKHVTNHEQNRSNHY